MNDEHYATPNADLKPQSTDMSDLLAPLLSTKPWVRLCSVMGFIFAVLTIFAAIGMFAMGNSIPGMPMGGGVLGVIYLLLGLLYFMPSFYLHKYASAIALADSTNSSTDIALALGYQKSFWKFAGIVTLIMLVLMVLGIGSAIMIPMMMAG